MLTIERICLEVVRLRALLLTSLPIMSHSSVHAQEMLLNRDTIRNESRTLPDSTLFFSVNGIRFKMIHGEGGTFMMGAMLEPENDAYDSDRSAHPVTLSSYYIGETVVTRAFWESAMGTSVAQHRSMNHIG